MQEEKLRTQLQSGLAEMGITLPVGGEEKLLLFCDLLLAANERMNLTAVREPSEVISRHFLDSLAPFLFPELRAKLEVPGAKMIDVGTGAGFPGIPLAIALPELQITLLDSLQKRISFLENVAAELGLKNVTLLCARAEEAARRPEHRERYDLAASRAVADLSPLLECSVPFLAINGTFLAYKSDNIEEELGRASTALVILGAEAEEPHRYTAPREDAERTLLPIIKRSPTPEKFPRRAGIPRKRPL